MKIFIEDAASIERSAIAYLIHTSLTNYCIDAKYASGIHYSEHENDAFADLLTSHTFTKPTIVIVETAPIVAPITRPIDLPAQLETMKKRRCAIKEAMHRYLALNAMIPEEWHKELNELHGSIHVINMELAKERIQQTHVMCER